MNAAVMGLVSGDLIFSHRFTWNIHFTKSIKFDFILHAIDLHYFQMSKKNPP